MSLVHEALLKAEREKQRKIGGVPIFVQRMQPVELRPTPPRDEQPAAAEYLSRPAEPLAQTATSPDAAPAQKSHQAVLVVVAASVALVAIVAIVFMVNRAAPTTRKTESQGVPSPAPAASAPTSPEVAGAPTEVPVQPATPPPPLDTSRYHITGIMKDPQGKYCAVINGRVVYAESYVDGATVKAIERDRVTLDESGREFVLRLN